MKHFDTKIKLQKTKAQQFYALLSAFFIILLFFTSLSTAQAQVENCNNGIDDDADGLVDFFDPDCPCNLENFFGYCADGCQFTEGFEPLSTLNQKWQNVETVTNYVTPIVADLYGDGTPRILAAQRTHDNPRVSNLLYVINGKTGVTETTITVPFFGWSGPNSFAVADVNGDGIAEIFIAAANSPEATQRNPVADRGFMFCYEFDGTTWVQRWRSDAPFGANNANAFGASVGIADFNQDGIPEVYTYNEIFNAQTGVKLLNGGADGLGIQRSSANLLGDISITIAANLDNNPNDLELAAGYSIYKVNITNPNGTAGNTIAAYNITVDAALRDGYTGIADINLDGQLDVVVASAGTATTSRLYAYNLVGTTPTIIAQVAMPTPGTGGGRDNVGPPFIGDMDGDGSPEIGVVRKERLIAYKYDGTTTFQQFWLLNTNDTSGETGLTMFDFNQDGVQEIVYRDETDLRIINGSTTTPANLVTIPCGSGTGADTPVVTDVDDDGAADICVPCGGNGAQTGNIRAYESPSKPWAPARKVWNQYGYHVTNINDNLSVPRQQQNNAFNFTPNGRILNNFMVQASAYDKAGNFFRPAADATIEINEAKIVGNTLNINFNVINTEIAAVALQPGVRVVFYSGNPTEAGADSLGAFITPADVIIDAGDFYNATLNLAYTGGDFDLFAVVNLDTAVLASNLIASPVNANQYVQLECNYDNNRNPDDLMGGGLPVVRALPNAQPDINTTLQDVPVSGNVITNDSDPSGGALTVTALNGGAVGVATPITGGTITLNANGTYTFVPTAGFTGEVSFTYTITNATGQSATTTVNITVYNPINTDVIIAQNDVLQVLVGESANGNILANDFSPNFGDILTVSTTPTVAPANGTVVINADGTYTYTPNCEPDLCYVGTDSFEYQVCNQFGDCATATVFITVSPSLFPNDNNPPFAQDDAVEGLQNFVTVGNVLSNDTDPDGNNLTVTASTITTPGVGTFVIGANGNFTFTPELNYVGPASFTYEVCDDNTPTPACDVATVYLTVRPPAPLAVDDINTVLVGGTTAGNVLTNDLGGTIAATLLVTSAQGVSITINTDGTYTYTPNANAEGAGADSFVYEICNAGICSQATVYIQVIENQVGNVPPVANNDVVQTISGIQAVGNVLGNDSDPNGDGLVVTPQSFTDGNGTFTLLADGTFTFTPAAGATGVFEYPYEVCDDATPTRACTTATIIVVVYPSPIVPVTAPPFAQDDAAIGLVDLPINGNVRTNDFDPNDPDALEITQINGTTLTGGTATIDIFNGAVLVGSVTISDLGVYTFTPASGFIGTTSFTYTVSNAGGSDVATVYLTVKTDDVIIANNDLNNTLQGQTVAGSVGTNDVAAGTLSYTGTTTVAGVGTFTINPANGEYTFVPVSGFTGTAVFPYTVCTDTPAGLCASAEVVINVIALEEGNNPPVVHNDILETIAGITASGNVLSNDFDPDFGQILTVTALNGNAASIGVATPITGGTLTLNADGTYTFVPTPDFEGTASFEYTVCDDATPQACEVATVNITVYPEPTTPPANYPPFAQDDTGAGEVNTIQLGSVLGNDTDPEGNTLVVTTVATATTIFAADGTTPAGTYTIDASGNYVFTPAAGFTGTTSFTYQVCADSPNCDIATVYLTVLPESPRAKDDINNTPIDTPVAGNLLTNDTNLGGGTPTITAINGNPVAVNTPIAVTGGTLVITNLATGQYTFIPDEGFTGEATFTYTVCNNLNPNLCSDASVSINVYQVSQDPATGNNPPVVHDDIVETVVGLTVSGSVLSNDFDPDGGQILTVTQLNGVDFTTTTTVSITGGSLTLNDDGIYTFAPDAGFTGTTSFEYTVCDNGTPQACEVATVTITVYPNDRANNPPFAQDDAIIVEVNTPYIANTLALGFLANDTEADGDVLTLTQINGAAFVVGNNITLPSGATLVITDAATGTYTYTPNPNYYGPDQFTYQICDNGTPIKCDVATVYVVVQPRNPNPLPDINNTLMNTPVSGNLLTNDSDPNGGTLVGNVNTTPVNGPSKGTIQINADGTYIYTPNFGAEGTDEVTYEVCNAAGLCERTTLTINIQKQLPQLPVAQNNAPVANNDVGQTLAGVDLTGNVLANDFDRDGTDLIALAGNVTLINNVTNGTLTLNADGTYTYIPAPNFVGEDSFTYEVCDDATPTPACATATVFITVYPNNNPGALAQINNPPFAQDDAGFVYQNATLTGTPLLLNDFDPEGGVLTVGQINGVAFTVGDPIMLPSGGTLTITDAATGAYTYTPPTDYTGPDSFTYQVCDNGTPVKCDVATVYLTIQAETPAPPIARNDLANTLINVAVSGRVIINDRDPFKLLTDLDVVSITSPLPAGSGVVVINADGTYTFTPQMDFVGTVSFTYQICNSAGLCSNATVFINVTDPNPAVNNAPVAQADVFETIANVSVSGNVLSNDFDVDGQDLRVNLVNGVTFTPGSPIVFSGEGTLIMNTNGSFEFTPDASFTDDTFVFEYEVCDNGTPEECSTVPVSIRVYPTVPPLASGYPPFAQNDAFVTYLDIAVGGDLSLNDSNLDNPTFSQVIGAGFGPANGTVTLQTNGTFTYLPNPGYSGPDFFTYQVCNTDGECATASVHILTINASAPLPLDLLSFEAVKRGEAVELIWKTINESEVSHFEVERGVNGLDFDYLGSVDARNLGVELSTYTFGDAQPLYGHNYYRLKQVEQDGSFVYSGMAYLNFEGELTMQVYPNPSPEQVTLKVNLSTQILQVEILDVSGRTLTQTQGTTNEAGELDVSLRGLSAGTYYLKVQIGTQNFTKVLVKY